MSCWYEIDRDAGPRRLPIGEVRHLLSPGQESISLEDPPAAALPIVWLWRSGGTFAGKSSAAANDRQRLPRARRAPMPQLDRGSTGGWMPLWLCPNCGKRARVLANPLMNWMPESESVLARHWRFSWSCLRCARFRYPSQRRPGGHRGQGKPPSWHYAAHTAALDRIEAAMATPQRLTLDRFVALESLKMAHHRLAVHALSQALPVVSSGLGRASVEQALAMIQANRWALRQTGWHRGGKPRPGPKGRAFAEAKQA